MNTIKLAKECGVQDDMETVGFMSCTHDQLEAFAQAVIEDYKASLVPVAYRATIPNKDGTYHWAFGEVKGSGIGVAWYTPLYEIELPK